MKKLYEGSVQSMGVGDGVVEPEREAPARFHKGLSATAPPKEP